MEAGWVARVFAFGKPVCFHSQLETRGVTDYWSSTGKSEYIHRVRYLDKLSVMVEKADYLDNCPVPCDSGETVVFSVMFHRLA